MSALKIEQNTQDWLEVRRKHLGASDAAVIMGVCKFKNKDGTPKTPFTLWQEKLGFRDNEIDTFATRFGKEQETPALREYEEMVDDHFEPKVLFHKEEEYSFMMASMDGVNTMGTKAVEIKHPSVQDHSYAQKGEVPPHYYPQVQHQIEVGEYEEIDYLSRYKKEKIIVKVKRDAEYLERYKKKAKKFWNCVETLKEPDLTDDDFIQRGEAWQEKAEQLWLIKQNKKALEAQEKMLDAELREISEMKNSYGGDYRYTVSSTKGSIDYKSIPALKKVDLEKYRKAPSFRCTLSKTA